MSTTRHSAVSALVQDSLTATRRLGRRLSAGQVFAAFAALSAVWIVGCDPKGADDDRNTIVDLVAFFNDAEIQLPTTEIQFGDPASRRLMVEGFHPNRRKLDGDRFASWTVAERAEVEFFVDVPKTLELTFRCAPVPRPNEDLPTVTLKVGERTIYEGPLDKGFKNYTAQIPAAALRRGENRITIEHPRVAPDARRPWVDTRVIWEWMRFSQSATAVPRAEAEDKTLLVSSGSRVDFFLDLPANARFDATRVVPRSHDGPFRVRWEPLEGPPIEQDLVRAERARVVLTGDQPASGRLSLSAPTADGGAGGGRGGIILVEPGIARVEGAASPPADSPVRTAAVPDLGEKPHLVVYLIDTLRADHLGAYGYPRNTSPHLDRFAAEEAVLFENSQAQTSWTRASVASMLTGLWSQLHGALDDPDMLADELVTLPERLQEAGYLTAGFVSNGNAADNFGFDQGFEHFEYLNQLNDGQRLARAHQLNDAVYAFLDAHKDDPRPLFLWIHTIDPHAPYMAPEPFHSQFSDRPRDLTDGSIQRLIALQTGKEPVPQEEIDHLIDLYDAEIAANDAAFGDLLEQLRARGLYDRTAIAVLSDHGEEFFEHGGLQHGRTLHSDQLDTPLIVRVPGMATGLRRPETAEHVDLAPTLLELAGAPPLETTQGHSLLPLMMEGEVEWWDNRSVAYLDLRGIQSAASLDRGGDHKTIVNYLDGEEAFPLVYDRKVDRLETTPLSGLEESLRGRYLASRLRLQISGARQLYDGGSADLPEETIEQLKALGYIQ
ncbi:MAG: sulfatase [Acidobacteriota bacterium]